MTLGFLGTLIALERAVALRLAWGYLAPLLSGVGGLAIVAGVPAPWPGVANAATSADGARRVQRPAAPTSYQLQGDLR